MAEDFKVIETQEQLDKIIEGRVNRAKDSARKEFEGYISPSDFETKTSELNKRIKELENEKAGFETQIAERDTKIKQYEKDSVRKNVALEYGLDMKLADRLQGETEEDIRKDAESLKEMFKPQYHVPMYEGADHNNKDTNDTALKNTVKKLRGEK